jgi:hypothetical protein
MSSYKSNKKYTKLPLKSRLLIDDFYNDGNLPNLLKGIKEDLSNQKTSNSKYVRISQYKSLLMKEFNFRYSDFGDILPNKNDTIIYNKKLEENFKNVEQIVITSDLLNDFLKEKELYIMIKSGRRYNEINTLYEKDGEIFYYPEKKRDNNSIDKIFVLGNKKKFVEILNELKQNMRTVSRLNKKIKSILISNNIDTTKNIKKSTHLMRAIYIALIHKYYNNLNLTIPVIANKYLNHKGFSSDKHYLYVVLDKNLKVPDDLLNKNKNKNKTKLLVKDIKKILNKKGINKNNIKRFNRLKKNELLKLLNENKENIKHKLLVKDIKKLLNDKGINENNIKRFNRLKKNELLKLLNED